VSTSPLPTPTPLAAAIAATDPADHLSRAAKFAGITSLTLHFPENNSDGEEDTTRVYYIGLRGKWTPVSSQIYSIYPDFR
jgi:hypothetical protein